MLVTGAASGSGRLRSSTDVHATSGARQARDYKLSHYVIASDPLTLDREHPVRVAFSTRSGINAVVPEQVWTRIAAGDWRDLSGELLDALLESRIVVPADEDELRAIIDENAAGIGDARELEQVIQPSAACQLGCSYCGQAHQAAHMSERVQDKLLERVDARLKRAVEQEMPFEAVNVGWFGAEPLLGLRAMRRLSPLLQASAHDHGCSYGARIVTNGMRLVPEVAHELQELHRVGHVEVTLDGPSAWHDARRFTKAGGPSFDKILRNLVAIGGRADLTFKLMIRCNVDEHNADAVPELIELLADVELNKRAGLYFSPIYAWGNDADRAALDPSDYATREIAWLAQMLQAGYHVDLLPKRRRVVCLAVRPGGRVTDAFGTEFNCTEVPYVPAYGTPNRYATGDVFGATGAEPFFRDFNEQVLGSEDAWCHTCRLLPVCGGACPKAWADGKPPCPSHKQNIKERVLLNFARARMSARS